MPSACNAARAAGQEGFRLGVGWAVVCRVTARTTWFSRVANA